MNYKMSSYKKRKLAGVLVSALLLTLGVIWFKFAPRPTFSIPLIIFSSFSGIYYLVYYLFEYEEDDAGSTGLLNLNAGRIDKTDAYRNR